MPKATQSSSDAAEPTGHKRHWKRWVLLAVVVVVVLLHFPGEESKITPGPDTTVLTAPLNEDGSVDYVAALNAENSAGVTFENNAAIPLLEALGADLFSRSIRQKGLRQLGWTGPDPNGLFVDWSDWAAANWEDPADADANAAPLPAPPDPAAFAPFGPPPGPGDANMPPGGFLPLLPANAEPPDESQLAEQAWDGNDLPPCVGKWLERNAPAFELATAASRRPRYWLPIVCPSDSDSLLLSFCHGLAPVRSLARALYLRAAVRFRQGDVDGAWQDILAIHRIAGLLGQAPDLIHHLVAIAVRSLADSATHKMACSGKLSGEQAQRMLKDLLATPVTVDVQRCIDRSERFNVLDALSMIRRRDIPLDSGEWFGGSGRMMTLMSHGLDWNLALRITNQWYDRLRDAAAEPNCLMRKAAFDRVYHEMIEAKVRVGSKLWWVRAGTALAGGRATTRMRTEIFTDIFLSVMMPGLGRARTLEVRCRVKAGLGELALALAAWRAEQGDWPAKLEQLAPDYIPAVPADPFAGGPMHYRPTPDGGYVLYSVNMDLVDDGGVESENRDEGDVAVRGPAADPNAASPTGARP